MCNMQMTVKGTIKDSDAHPGTVEPFVSFHLSFNCDGRGLFFQIPPDFDTERIHRDIVMRRICRSERISRMWMMTGKN